MKRNYKPIFCVLQTLQSWELFKKPIPGMNVSPIMDKIAHLEPSIYFFAGTVLS